LLEVEEMELGDYVTRRIEGIFTDLAEDLSREDLPADVMAGVPMALFRAELYLKGAWLAYVGGDNEQVESAR